MKITLSSQATDLVSEKAYLELTSRLCYYGEPNANGVVLPVEGASEHAQSLVNQPVVARYRRINNQDDLGGHEEYIDPTTNEMKFRTATIGTHTAVEVKDDEVEVNGEKKTLPCLFAKYRVWTRNQNVAKAVARLFSEGKLFSSWEIASNSYTYDNGIKTISDYDFEANCLLGSTYLPAYGCAQALTLSSLDEAQTMLAEAMVADNIGEENEPMERKEASELPVTEEILTPEAAEEPVGEQRPVTETPDGMEGINGESPAASVVEDKPTHEENGAHDIASLTFEDIRRRLYDELYQTMGDCYIAMMFPEEHYVLVRKYGNEMDDLEFLRVPYTVSEDTVVIGEPEKVRLAIAVDDINNYVATTSSAISAANTRVKELEAQVSELLPYKEREECAAKEAKQAELRAYALSSELIQEEELTGEGEIARMISELDQVGIDGIIAKRFMASRKQEPHHDTVVSSRPVATNLAGARDTLDTRDVVKMYLGK